MLPQVGRVTRAMYAPMSRAGPIARHSTDRSDHDRDIVIEGLPGPRVVRDDVRRALCGCPSGTVGSMAALVVTRWFGAANCARTGV